MPDLSPFHCGQCGATVELDLGAVVSALLHCDHCGAALAAPPSMAFDVRIEPTLDRGTQIRVTQALMAAQRIPIGMAKDFVTKAPTLIRCGASAAEASQLREKLVAAGASVTVLPCPGQHPS